MDRSWITIDCRQIIDNYKKYKKSINQNTEIMAVVKANAYGHGAVKIADILQEEGVDNFAVATIDEAIELREAGIKGNIIILGYTPIDNVKDLIKYDIIQTIVSKEYAEKLSLISSKIKVQFAIDTGMNRIGLDADKVEECEKIIRYYNRKMILMGCFTHLCVADTNEKTASDFTKMQIDKFYKIISRIKDLELPYNHFLNSAGGLYYKEYESSLVRLGIVLYGLKPDYSNILPQGIKPALEWKSVISMVKKVYPGETIGYGRTYVVDHEMKVATVSTGYADGYNRLLSNKGYVLCLGKKARILGRICMDQFMIDVTDIFEAEEGTQVTLVGNDGTLSITADDMASWIGTIGYEIVCNISNRVKKYYI